MEVERISEYINGAKRAYVEKEGPVYRIYCENGGKTYCLNDNNYSFEEWDRLRKMIWML